MPPQSRAKPADFPPVTAARAGKKAAAPADPNANGKAFVRAMVMPPMLAWQAAMTPKAATRKK